MNPGISVIIPVLNRRQLVIRCLDSIVNQTFRPQEIIVVDNGSTDGTPHEVETWMKRQSDSGINLKLLHQPIKGACSARQMGLENATQEYVQFFDSDDTMRPTLLEKALNVVNKNHHDIVCWPCVIHQLNNTDRVPPFLPGNPLESHLIHTLLRPQGYLVKKDFLIQAGGWEKSVPVWNDFELGLRLLLNQPSIGAVNEILADIYSQENSITGTDFSSKEGAWEAVIDEMEKVTEQSGTSQIKKIHKILNYRRAILAAHYKREGNSEGASRLLAVTKAKSTSREWPLLLFAYYYTSKGLRGAWRIIGKFL